MQKLKDIGATVEPVATDWGTALTRGNSKNAPDQGGWSLFHTWTVGQILGSAISVRRIIRIDPAAAIGGGA